MCMYMNDMANLILILSCIHVHVGIYVILGLFVITCTFCWPLGSGVAFYSSGFGQHDHLDAVRQTKSNILRKKSVVVASLCPRFALMNEID